MRRPIVLSVLALAILASGAPASAGIEPSPFYSVRPNLDLLRGRLEGVQLVYQDPVIMNLASRVSSRVVLIDGGTIGAWVTEPITVQGLGVINHIASVLGSAAPPAPGVALRLLTIADRIANVLTDPSFTPSEFSPQVLRALGHMSQGLGWDDDTIHPTIPNAAAFDILMRMSAALFDPQPEPPRVVTEGVGALERLSAVLFAPQPEPPRVMTQIFDVMDRVSAVLGAPQVGTPDVAERSLDLMERMSAVLFAPQPEPPKVMSGFDVFERIAAVLFAPQPEPPKVTNALNIMSRITAVLFAPQPEPPMQPYMDLTEFGAGAVSVVYHVSGASEWAELNGFSGEHIPGMTGLTQLSKHLTTAVSRGNGARADAHLGAMLEISQKYVY